jgi:hypothetical protein
MTEEQRIRAVERELDGTNELIAHARGAFQEYFEELLHRFYTGSIDACATPRCNNCYESLSRALGAAEAKEINDEEWQKFAMQSQREVDPEIWDVFMNGPFEDWEAFPRSQAGRENFEAAVTEWIEDRKDKRNRAAYAQAFYRVKS